MTEEVITDEEKAEIAAKLESIDEDKIVEDELNSEQADILLTELRTGRRYFTVEGIGDLFICNPSVKDQQEADREGIKALSQALRDGILTPEEMEELLDNRGLFVDMQDKLNKSIAELTRLNFELDNYSSKTDAKSKKKEKDIAVEMANIREEATRLRMEKDSYLRSTTAGISNDARSGYIVSRCIKKVDTEERLWPTYEDYLNETDVNLLSSVTINYLTFSNGISADFIRQFPESKVLNEIIT
ncbi:MAG: hypothetical protein WC476_01170 [Phycisphaerae bacterium]|jgi:hypothetical protein